MKLSNFFLIKSVISVVFGILLVIVPVMFMGFSGMTLDQNATILSRFFGAMLLGVGLVCWFAKSAADSEFLRGVLLALFIADTIGFVVALVAQLAGAMNALGWVYAVIWLLLALGLGYFRFLKSS